MTPRIPLATLAIAAALWATPLPTADASFIAFTGPPAPAGALTFFANGGLSGQVAIDLMAPQSSDGFSTGPSFPITGGLLTFNLGLVLGVSDNGNVSYRFGGSVMVTGSFAGGPGELLLFCDRQMNGGTLIRGPGDTYRFDLGGLSILSGLAGSVGAAYGPPASGLGKIGVEFTGTPGGTVAAGARVWVSFQTVAAVVPEPASAGLAGVGGVMASWWVRRRTARVGYRRI